MSVARFGLFSTQSRSTRAGLAAAGKRARRRSRSVTNPHLSEGCSEPETPPLEHRHRYSNKVANRGKNNPAPGTHWECRKEQGAEIVARIVACRNDTLTDTATLVSNGATIVSGIQARILTSGIWSVKSVAKQTLWCRESGPTESKAPGQSGKCRCTLRARMSDRIVYLTVSGVWTDSPVDTVVSGIWTDIIGARIWCM